MALEIPILIKGGTEEARTGADVGTREPNFATDSKRLYIGDHLIGWPFAESALLSADLSSTGSTNLVVTSGYGLHMAQGTLGAGAGAYNRKLLLPALESGGAAVIPGSIYDLQIIFPASTNPTLEVRSETAVGPLLWSFTPPEAAARMFTLRFVRYGGAWLLWNTNEPLT